MAVSKRRLRIFGGWIRLTEKHPCVCAGGHTGHDARAIYLRKFLLLKTDLWPTYANPWLPPTRHFQGTSLKLPAFEEVPLSKRERQRLIRLLVLLTSATSRSS